MVTLESLTDRLNGATAIRQQAAARVEALEAESVALASQVATMRVAAEQAEAAAAMAMARAGAVAAELLTAEEIMARAREAVEEAEEEMAKQKAKDKEDAPKESEEVGPLKTPGSEMSEVFAQLLAVAAEAEAKVAAITEEKTAVEDQAQEIAQRGIAASEAAQQAVLDETALQGKLKSAKQEETAALQTLIAIESALAEFRARVEAGGAVAEVQVAQPVTTAAPEEPALTAAERKEAANEEQESDKSSAAPQRRGQAGQHPGSLMSGMAMKQWDFSGPTAAATSMLGAARKRLGIVGFALAIFFAVSLVVPLPMLQRVWGTGLPPVAAAVHTVAIEGKKLVDKGRSWVKSATQKEHTAADGHGGGEHSQGGLSDVLYLLGTSVLAVPIISKLPGGSPVLGFLFGGALIGPNAMGLISNVETVKHIAEIGVVFLLFNIGLELSLERLQSMAKYVFGLGSAQVLVTTIMIAAAAMTLGGLPAPAAIVVGVGLAFSSTAVALQVLGDRGEAASRHGRAAFSVLLLQDLAVVLVFMLVPLLAAGGGPDGQIQGHVILMALLQAVCKTGAAIVAIMAVGRVVLRPVYRRIADLGNTEIFSATTLLVALGTSHLTGTLGLSEALGAFLAGLLLAETEYHLQVESDIAPYRGLLLGLFFMTVGMTIDPQLLLQRIFPIIGCIALLLFGKVAVVTGLGKLFGLQTITAARTGMYLGPAGEFAFVTFGLAVSSGLLTQAFSNELTLVVALSMAMTPALADLGAKLREKFNSSSDMKSLAPGEGATDDLVKHVVICGFGRSGQLIAQLMSEQLIPFVVLDMSSERVQTGREQDMPVYFGDAGSPAVLHSVGAERAACAVVTMDTPSANYRTVWALNKHYPDVAIYVRASDVADGLLLEKAGASVCVPETLEPSLQLAAAVLHQLAIPTEDVVSAIESFRQRNMAQLRELASLSGTSLGYGEFKDDAPEGGNEKSASALTPALMG